MDTRRFGSPINPSDTPPCPAAFYTQFNRAVRIGYEIGAVANLFCFRDSIAIGMKKLSLVGLKPEDGATVWHDVYEAACWCTAALDCHPGFTHLFEKQCRQTLSRVLPHLPAEDRELVYDVYSEGDLATAWKISVKEAMPITAVARQLRDRDIPVIQPSRDFDTALGIDLFAMVSGHAMLCMKVIGLDGPSACHLLLDTDMRGRTFTAQQVEICQAVEVLSHKVPGRYLAALIEVGTLETLPREFDTFLRDCLNALRT